MRLIDADELKNLPFERMIHTDFGKTAIPIEEIDNAPTVTPEKALLNLQEYCSEHGCDSDCALYNSCTSSPCDWSSKDIGIMVKVMENEVSD